MFIPVNSKTSIATPGYAIDTSHFNIIEGDTLKTVINTINVKAGTNLLWKITGIDDKDLAKGSLTGTGVISSDGSFSFSHQLRKDLTTEGTEELTIAIYSRKDNAKPVALTSLDVLDNSIYPENQNTYQLNTSSQTINRGDRLTTTIETTNVEPGTTLFWSITGIDDKDLSKGELSGSGMVSNDGSFSISQHFSEDLSIERAKEMAISLYTDKSRKNSVSQTTVSLISTEDNIAPETDLKLKDLVIPARLADKRIPIQSLIDFSNHKKSTSFTLKNSKRGGYFEYEGKQYQGVDLRDINGQSLKKLYYIPKAPQGHYDASKINFARSKSPTQNIKQESAVKKNTKGSTQFITTESLRTIQKRQDPFNPLSSIKNQVNPSIHDHITVTAKTPQGHSQTGSAEWITRGNWKPEITLLQKTFEARKREESGIALTEIIDIHDPDGDNIKKIEIKDLSKGSTSSHFEYKNKAYQGTSLPIIEGKDLADVFFHPGPGGINRIEVSAMDALQAKSRRFSATLKTQNIQPASFSNLKQSFVSSDIGKPIALNHLIKIEGKKADDKNIYSLTLSNNNQGDSSIGYFSAKNKRLSEKQLNGLSLKALSEIRFTPTTSNAKSVLTLKATDLLGKTRSMSTTWSTAENKRPSLTIENVQLDPIQTKKPIPISNLIQAEDDAGVIKSFTLRTLKGSGGFQFKGKTYAKQALKVKAADLDRVTYQIPRSGQSDRIMITASDGNQDSRPASANWGTNKNQQQNPQTRAFSIGINEEWAIGDFLNVPNERTYSKFLGMDQTIPNVNLNSDIGVAGVRFKTGNTRIKTGLQLDAGYGLGSLALQGGLSARATLNDNGISFRGSSSAPSLELALPYAYLDLNAVGKFKFDPSLKVWHDVWFSEGTTDNLLNFLKQDIDINRSLINLDTRHLTGNNYTRSFNIGALSANASIPNFGRVSELNRIPPAIATSNAWGNGFGNGSAYGIEGSTTMLDLNLSLGQAASYFGLPLAINKSIWGDRLSVTGTLADASIGIDADLNYSAKIAVKPNVFAIVEGSARNTKYDILGEDRMINPNQFRDTNNDGNISITIEADPIIAANASVSIDGGVRADAELLSATTRLNKWGYNPTWNVGPLWSGGPWNLYSNEVSLIDMTRSYALSDLAPNLQDQLSVTLELPIA